ncbi:unnamed protein product [Rhizophagus irregularis]|nr:unnamed protein product [Rhizophagus irregularis]CAB4445329.1 unnamed protein product [Rhizophagus irregularis]
MLHKVNIGLKRNYTCQEDRYGARIIELEYSYNFGKFSVQSGPNPFNSVQVRFIIPNISVWFEALIQIGPILIFGPDCWIRPGPVRVLLMVLILIFKNDEAEAIDECFIV